MILFSFQIDPFGTLLHVPSAPLWSHLIPELVGQLERLPVEGPGLAHQLPQLLDEAEAAVAGVDGGAEADEVLVDALALVHGQAEVVALQGDAVIPRNGMIWSLCGNCQW